MYKLYNLENNIIGDYMIRDIMTYKIVSANKDDSIKDISLLMKNNNLGFIPIKDKEDYIGVITDRDIVANIVSNGDIDCDITNYMTKNIISINVILHFSWSQFFLNIIF